MCRRVSSRRWGGTLRDRLGPSSAGLLERVGTRTARLSLFRTGKTRATLVPAGGFLEKGKEVYSTAAVTLPISRDG